MSKITNIGAERGLSEMRRRRERKKRDDERKIDVKVSSCSETERRNRMLRKAAFI